MRVIRFLTGFSLLALCAATFAQVQTVLGKVGEATNYTAVYSSANFNSRILYRVRPSQRLVVRNFGSDEWQKVLLHSGHYGFVPSGDVTELPYTVYRTTRRPRVASTSSRSGSAVTGYGTGSVLADTALKFEGTPYEWGGNDLQNGIDCSGFVKKLVGAIDGVNLPRTAAEQALVGQPLHHLEELVPGDRLYFKQKSDTKISHTGIYIGNGRFVHSSHGKGKVTTDSLLNPGWRKMLVAARR